MSSAWSMPLRAFATQTAVITLIGLGLAAPATAAPGDTGADKRSDRAATAKAEASEKQSTRTSGTATRGGGTAKASGSSTTKSSTPPAKDPEDSRRTQTGEQPVSKADQNSGGANGDCSDDERLETGQYCGTDRTNKPSGNGQGKGEAVGKPFQAHKGKADNKNPPGQVGNTRDNGYECDENKGIARGNPAHTACDEGNGGGGGGGGTVGGVDTVTPPVVKGVEKIVPPAGVELRVRPQGEAPAQVLPGAAVLPATGATTAMTALSAAAFALLALGSGLLLYRRMTA